MDLKEVGLLGADEGRHWYYASKARALRRCLGRRNPGRILDVGAGSGFFSRMLLVETAAPGATCVDPGYPSDVDEAVNGKPLAFRRTSPVGDADLVLLMDVLEHVDDDVALLREYAAAARPGTRFVVSVPAFAWLWSGHDKFLEHRRRYTLAQLLRVMSAAGLADGRGFYFFGLLFPVVAVQRLSRRWRGAPGAPASDLRRHHPVTNRVLRGICLAESIVAIHNRAFGLTAFGIAEKPGKSGMSGKN
jgi:SAM-dependent methyltransferase